MEAYEFYWRDPKGRYRIIGILPERRQNSARATKESIMHWGEIIFGDDLDTKDIFFIRVTIDEDAVGDLRSIPLIISQREVRT